MHKTSPHRNQRLADQIQRDLAELIPRELRNPSLGLITLQSIELSPDLAHAKVFFSVLGAEPEVALKALQDKAGYLHSLLFKRLRNLDSSNAPAPQLKAKETSAKLQPQPKSRCD